MMTEKQTGEALKKQDVERKKCVLKEKLSEVAVRPYENKYRQLFELVSDALFLIDNTTGRILEANCAASEMYGYPHKELLELRNVDLSAEPDSTMRATREEMTMIPMRYHKKKGGAVFPVEITGSHFDWHGRKVHIAAIRDIGWRLEAEEALLNSEKRLNDILKTVNLIAVSLDDKGDITFCNDFFLRLTGWKREEVLDKSWFETFIPPDIRKDLWHGVFMKAIDTGDLPAHYQNEIITKHGERRLVNWSNIIFHDAKKDAIVLTSIGEDITERQKLEGRIQQAQKMESIGNLAGGIAHDFNNLLAPIIGMTELLLEDLAPDSLQHENAKEILKAGDRCRDLVAQILAFSRQTENKMIPVRVQTILKEVLKLSRSTIPSNIEIAQDLQSDCSLVIADPTQLHQVAMNLITNAYHAVEPTGGQITVRLRETEIDSDASAANGLKQGRYAMLTISDTGCGIDPSIRDKIFMPYFTTKEQSKGTGFGLAVAYGIVKDHNGDIEVQSDVGKGAAFNVYLPVMEKSPEEMAPERLKSDETGTERILLVDDEAQIISFTRQMLERLGYRVTARTSSMEALEAFRANPGGFELVLTDMAMPNMTGDQLARELISIRSNIPVIICTGFSTRINKEKSKDIGIKGFLMKPIIKAEMAQLVRKVLDEAKETSQEK
jgi:PAS domain S-box-containing protein